MKGAQLTEMEAELQHALGIMCLWCPSTSLCGGCAGADGVEDARDAIGRLVGAARKCRCQIWERMSPYISHVGALNAQELTARKTPGYAIGGLVGGEEKSLFVRTISRVPPWHTISCGCIHGMMANSWQPRHAKAHRSTCFMCLTQWNHHLSWRALVQGCREASGGVECLQCTAGLPEDRPRYVMGVGCAFSLSENGPLAGTGLACMPGVYARCSPSLGGAHWLKTWHWQLLVLNDSICGAHCNCQLSCWLRRNWHWQLL